MIIGIDIDNTIIDYSNSFKKLSSNLNLKKTIIKDILNNQYTKKQIKKKIYADIGEDNWRMLQGQVYSIGLKYASLFPEFINFLISLKNRKVKLYLISHKTKYAHSFNNKKILLRNKCLNFLNKKNLFNQKLINKKNVFFCDNRNDKVLLIKKLRCDYFIDDLKEIFTNENFPQNTKKILFNDSTYNKDTMSFNSWQSIRKFFFLNYNLKDIYEIANFIFKKKITSVSKINSEGKNSEIYKIVINNKNYCLKIYPDLGVDNRRRLILEKNNLLNLRKNKIKNIPKLIKSSEDLNINVLEWLQNDKNKIAKNLSNLQELLFFIKILKQQSSKLALSSENASASCFNGQDIKEQILYRYNKILKSHFNIPELIFYLKNKIYPILKKEIKISQHFYPSYFKSKYKLKNLFFSPSDLGFHNTIKVKNRINFIDFEYSGIDDPVKLICDFILRPSNNISKKMQIYWFEKNLSIFKFDKDFKKRLISSINLYAFCWILIIFNDLDDIKDKKYKILRTKKLMLKSKSLVDKISDNYYKDIINEL